MGRWRSDQVASNVTPLQHAYQSVHKVINERRVIVHMRLVYLWFSGLFSHTRISSSVHHHGQKIRAAESCILG